MSPFTRKRTHLPAAVECVIFSMSLLSLKLVSFRYCFTENGGGYLQIYYYYEL